MGNCGSRRNQEKTPTIKSPKGDNKLNSDGKNFQPVKKDESNADHRWRTTPTPFNEKGKEKLLF